MQWSFGQVKGDGGSALLLSGAPPAAPLTARLSLSAVHGAAWMQVNGDRLDGYTDTYKRTMIPASALGGLGLRLFRAGN